MKLNLTIWYYKLDQDHLSQKYKDQLQVGVSVLEDQNGDHNKYLAAALLCDFQTLNSCENFNTQITQVQQCKKSSVGWSGNAFDICVYRDRVEIDHQQFAGHPDWPTWTCPLPVFVQALQGYMAFLKLPVGLDTSLIIELDV